MKLLYKLTDENGRTYGDCQWGENVTHKATGDESQGLCSNAYIHAYEHPLLALLFNPIHADFKHPILWEAEGEITKRDGQLKCGCRELTTIRKVDIPEITIVQRQRFAILVVIELRNRGILKPIPKWDAWAEDWLSGKNRTAAEAGAAEAGAWAAAAAAAAWAAAAEAGAWAAAWAARAAAEWAAEEIDFLAIAQRALVEEK